jgi:hypothetical protein
VPERRRGALRFCMFAFPDGSAPIAALAAEATAEGHGMVARLVEEWATGVNRFDKPGERCYWWRSTAGSAACAG